MTDSSMISERLLRLAETICDETASADDFAQLDALLLDDENARRRFLDYCQLHFTLGMELQTNWAVQKVHEQIDLELQPPILLCPTLPMSRSAADQPPNSAGTAAFATEKGSLAASVSIDLSEAAMPVVQPAGASVFGFLSTAVHGTVGFFSQEIPFSLLIATVITCLGLLAGSMVHVSQSRSIAQNSSSRSASRPSFSPTSDVVGRITAMADVKWEEGSKFKLQGSGPENLKSLVALGDKFTLASGLLEMTYDTGAKVILEGPVTYKVESATGGFLSIGKLTARLEKSAEGRGESQEKQSAISGQQSASAASVANQKSEILNHKSLASSPQPLAPNAYPQSLIPNPSPLSTLHHPLFTIKTPTATVTDLGTEFGVEVSKDGLTNTQVFDGTVQIVSVGEPGIGSGQTQVLRAGQYASVNKNRAITTGKIDSEKLAKRFTRIIPQPQSAGDAYAKLVLSMNPVVYYRMDQWPAADKKNHYVLVDSAPGGHHGIACLDEAFGKPSSPGKFGGALDLHGSMSTDHAFVKNYPKAENGQLSVSAWAWAVTLEPWSVIAANWCTPQSSEPYLGQFAIGISDKSVFGVGMLQQDGGHVKIGERGDKPLPRSQWQHVAFVADGIILRLYRNGREVGTSPCRGIAHQSLPECLSIGCVMDKDGTRPRPGSAFVWNGRLDEIAVFNHALTVEQVRQLYCKQAIAK